MISTKVFGADPHVLFDEKTKNFYCYATSGHSNGKSFHVYRSKDLVEWEDLGLALDTETNRWGKDWYWAPECYYNPHNGKYYLFYHGRDLNIEKSNNDKRTARICELTVNENLIEVIKR